VEIGPYPGLNSDVHTAISADYVTAVHALKGAHGNDLTPHVVREATD
jgi:hypothetical protein